MTPNSHNQNFPRRLLLGAEIIFTPLEWLAVLGPIVFYFPSTLTNPIWMMGALIASVVWFVLAFFWLDPLRIMASSSSSQLALIIRAIRLPTKLLSLRLGLWFAVGLIWAVLFHQHQMISGQALFTVLSICVFHSLAISLLRWGMHKRLIRSAVTQQKEAPSWTRLQALTIFDRLLEASLVLGAVTISFLAVFTFLFVPVTIEQYLQIETYFPSSGLVLGLIWFYWTAMPLIEPLEEYFKKVSDQAPLDADQSAFVCSYVHRLPWRLSLIKFGFFTCGGLILFVQAVTLYGYSLLQSLFILTGAIIVTLGTSIYEMLWSRAILRPISAYLVANQDPEKAVAIPAQSLRRKMLLSFGGTVIFTVALALFWTFLQYGNLSRDFTATQARRELAMTRALIKGKIIDEKTLNALPSLPGSKLIFIPQTGAVDTRIPVSIVERIRRQSSGSFELPKQNLAGEFIRLHDENPMVGSLLVVVPSSTSGKFSLNISSLIFFFSLILAISLGVVLLTSVELTKPLALLEARAADMAAGKLNVPISPYGELDEIGRLTTAFEKMRRALQEKITAIEQLNLGLEDKVACRTAELQSTINALNDAQRQLVLSEKMASVGQLVAGIAHEINNPLNAMINTVEPLSEEIKELAKTHTSEEREAKQQDIAHMLRVIRSGAERTQRIVLALRSYARQNNETLSLVDLHADIEETLALLGHQLRGVEIARDFQASAALYAYRGQLNQALMNLLANAAAALEKCKSPRLLIRTSSNAQLITIIVEDNGSGIATENLARIFDPFFTTKEVGKGTGLGLSITHRIVEHHRGQLRVESDGIGKGARFVVEIPLNQAG